MEVEITKDMINTAIINVDNKLAKGVQKERLYTPKAHDNQYYINNIIGELGELVFAKSVEQHGYVLNIKPFGTFMNSDICDFYTSKTNETIDVKTVYKKNADNLIVNKNIADWREVHSYVLVKIITDENLKDLESIFKLNKAEVLGSFSFKTIKNPNNVKNMYGKQVYFIKKERLSPIKKLIATHFYRKLEKERRYYSEGKLRLEIASFEEGAVPECENSEEINELANNYRDVGEKGHYNFISISGRIHRPQEL